MPLLKRTRCKVQGNLYDLYVWLIRKKFQYHTPPGIQAHVRNSQFKKLTICKKGCDFNLIAWVICILLINFGSSNFMCWSGELKVFCEPLLHWYMSFLAEAEEAGASCSLCGSSVCMLHGACGRMHVWRSEDNMQKLVLLFFHVGPQDQTRVPGPGSLRSPVLLYCGLWFSY